MTVRRMLDLILLTALSFVVLGACDWFEPKPEDNIPPETEILNCPNPGEIPEGRQIVIKWMGTDVDGRIIGYEWMLDSSQWTFTEADSVLLSEVAVGEHTLIVRSIDDDGDHDPDPAQCDFTVVPAGQPVQRVVLVELFTTNTCRNCPKPEAALNSLLGEFGRGNLCVIAYHNLPESDGLATEETAQRIDWYTDNTAFPGHKDTWPIAVFDGKRVVEGAETEEWAEASYRHEIQATMAVDSPLSLGLEVEGGDASYAVKAHITVVDRLPQGTLRLRLVLIEDDVYYEGFFSNEFDFVARDILDTEVLTVSSIGESTTVMQEFEVDASWNVNSLDVIGFVQIDETMEVVQSARAKVATE